MSKKQNIRRKIKHSILKTNYSKLKSKGEKNMSKKQNIWKAKLIFTLLISIIYIFILNSKNIHAKETGRNTNNKSGFVRSLVQTTEFLKLKINNPMTLGEYTAKSNDNKSLIKSLNSRIIFVQNKGQIIDTDGKFRYDINYKASLNGVDLYLTNKGMSFVFYGNNENPKSIANSDEEINKTSAPDKINSDKDKLYKIHRMDLDIVGINPNPTISGEEQTEGFFNYYFTHGPESILNVLGYRKVLYENVYDNIDLVYYSFEKGLKYDFVVKPGGDVSDIKLKYRNENATYLTDKRKIIATNPIGEIKNDILYTYQSDGKVVESNYKLDSDGTISIITGEYDRDKNLIIDPHVGATYYGGSGKDYGYSITTDESNNILITGSTQSADFPLFNPGGSAYYQGMLGGSVDIFILKFNSNGVRLWATYYGGSYPDAGFSISTDGSNNILITGQAGASFPVYNPGGGAYFKGTGGVEPFILKFNSNGVRLWATYYGGSYAEDAYSITTDANNNILVTGRTPSPDFPVYNPGGGAYFQGTNAGSRDAFILKFDSNGVRLWATYYGGSYADEGYSITSDENNNILITGWTMSSNFPVYNPGGGAYFQGTNGGGDMYDAFILKFNPNGVRLWATYYGGAGSTAPVLGDAGYSITTDGSNNILVTGRTQSADFPVYSGGGAYGQGYGGGNNPDVFILKFNPDGVRQWASYYGGVGVDIGRSITTDGNNKISVTGSTRSSVFPLLNPGGETYFQSSMAGDQDLFVLKFDSSGVRRWATYYGGSGEGEEGRSITTDFNHNILLTGWTNSLDFPVFNPGGGAYFQDSLAGGVWDFDAFIISFDSSGILLDIQDITASLPKDYALLQNYPNPFNPTTVIKFGIPKNSSVKLIVYDILGREVAKLVNEKLNAGLYEYIFDGTGLTSAIYFYRLKAGEFVETKKMLMIK